MKLHRKRWVSVVMTGAIVGALLAVPTRVALASSPTVVNVSATTANGNYGKYDTIDITVQFSAPVTVTGTPTLGLETGTSDATASYISGSTTDTLTFRYTVAAGNSSTDLDYASTSSLSGTIKLTSDSSVNATRTLPTPGAAGSLAANKNIVIMNFVFTNPQTNSEIGIARDPTSGLFFVDSGGTAISSISANGATLTSSWLSAANSPEYFQVVGDYLYWSTTGAIYKTLISSPSSAITVIDPSSPSSFTSFVRHQGINYVNTYSDRKIYVAHEYPVLATPAASNSLGANKAIVVDTTAPSTVTLARSAATSASATISFTVTGSEAITCSTLSTASGDDFDFTNISAIDRIVQTSSTVCTITATSTATAGGGTVTSTLAAAAGFGITDTAGNNQSTLTISSQSVDVTISSPDSTAPSVSSVTSSTADGSYKEGDVIAVQVVFSEPVTVSGTPRITLETGTTDRTVDYAFGSGTSTLTFNYTVQAGDTSSDLDYTTTTALALNGGTIRDASSNNATLTLASPGQTNSLRNGKAIVVDTTAPTSVTLARSAATSTARTITFTVTGSEAITCSTLSTTAGTDFDLTNISTIDRIVQTSSTVCTITATSTATAGSGATTSTLTAAASFGVTDTAGNNRGTLTNSPQSITVTIASPDATAPTVSSVTSSTANGSYKSGDVIAVQVVFSEPVTVTGTPQITLETGATDRTVDYASGSGTSTLTFNYTVQAGDTSSDLDYVATNSLALNGGTIRDAAGNNVTPTATTELTTLASGINNVFMMYPGPDSTSILALDSTTGKAYKVNTSNGTTTEHADLAKCNGGSVAQLRGMVRLADGTEYYTFYSPSDVVGRRATDGTITCPTLIGSPTTYSYTRAMFQITADANALYTVTSVDNMDTRSGFLKLTPNTSTWYGGAEVSFSDSADTTAPSVSSVSASTANGSYNAGETITVQVNFSESVNVTGTPQITLETGSTDRIATYSSGSTSSALLFTYTVQDGDTSSDLDYVATNSLALNGGTIADAAGNNATLTLASPGAANSLGANKAIVIDTTAPTLSTATIANGSTSLVLTYNESLSATTAAITAFSATVNGTSRALLSKLVSGSSITLTIASGVSWGDSVSVSYTDPGVGDDANALQDTAGNDAGSLASQAVTVTDTTAPTVSSVSASTANGSYKTGDVVNVEVNFSESVNVTGTPQLTLETGSTDRSIDYTSGTGSAKLIFAYTVQAGDTSSDLNYVATTSLTLNGGTIADTSGNNATLTLPATNNASSLAGTKAIVIDTTAPTATWTSPATPSSSRTLTYTLAFSETVSDIASGDFSNTGSAGGCSFSPSATSGSSITVTVTCTSDGTVVARLATSGVTDVAGNTGPASNADASSVTIDMTSGTTTTTAAPATTTTVAPTTTTTTTIPRTRTTSSTTTTTTTVPAGSVGVNSWTITASPNPVAPGQRFVLTTTISCGRQMSVNAAPYYPSMYYMVRSSPWINGVYSGPTLSDGRRTATFSVTVTAPSQPGNYAMYAYGRDNPFGRTCTGDSYNFANSGTFTLTVGNPTVLATTTTLPAESTTTTSIRIRTPEIPTTTSTTVVRTATTVAVRRITICHATGSTNNPYVAITVDASSLGGHDDHEDDIIPAPAGGCPRTLQPGANTRATTTTTVRATSTTAVDTGTVGINSWTMTASPNPAQPGERVVLTTTISCGRRMSTTAPPYYPSMYYMVRSSPWINGVYRGPALSADGRTATFSVTVTAPSRSGTYGMYAYGRDNPFGRTCTGDSYNFANSQNFSFVVSGDAASTSTSSSTTTTSTTTTTLTVQTISICVWQPTSSRPVAGSSGRYVARSIPREDAGEYRGPFNLIPAPVDGCPDRIQLASTATTTSSPPTTTSTTSVAPSSTTTTTSTSVAPTTTTPIYEPPVQDSPTPTTLPNQPPATIPARPETVPDPAFLANDGEVEAAIQVVDANEVPSLLSVQGRLVLTSGNFVKVRGKGFDRAGFAEVWLFSTPRLLGRVPKDDSGNFVGRVRIPEGVEEGEHTIELRAVTKRAKVVTVSVPAIVLGANDNSTDDTVATTVPTSPVDIGTATTLDTSSTTAPLSTSVNPIRIQPGATELVVPIATIVAVVNEILGASADASTALVRVRIDTQPWQNLDLRDDSDLVLPLDPSSAALEVEVTPAGGQPIVRSIEIAVRTEGTRLTWWLAVIAMIATFFVWIVMRRRRHDDDDR